MPAYRELFVKANVTRRPLPPVDGDEEPRAVSDPDLLPLAVIFMFVPAIVVLLMAVVH